MILQGIEDCGSKKSSAEDEFGSVFKITWELLCVTLPRVGVSGLDCHTHTETRTHTHCYGIKSIAPFHSLLSESPSLPGLLPTFLGTGQPGPAGLSSLTFCACIIAENLSKSHLFQEVRQDWCFSAPASSLCDFFLQPALPLYVSEDLWLCQFLGS